MTPIALVLFDLDGVLVEYERDVRIRHLAAAVGSTPERVHAALFASGLEDRFDAGEVDTGTYLHLLGDSLGAAVSRAAWAAARGAAMRLAPDTLAHVRRVSQRCDVAVLTNNGSLLVDVLPSLLPDLADLFGARLLCSARLGHRKPAPEAYREALRRLGHAAGDTLFLDDVIANVEGARSAGLHAAHVPASSHLGAALSAYGLA